MPPRRPTVPVPGDPASAGTGPRSGLTSLAAIRSGFGQRTAQAAPAFSNSQITRAEMPAWPRSAPCRALAGSAWCRL
ncbi:hypothetical protein ACH4OY_25185 [Micromonospora rubida]|uniref:Uncharacterized protein n=1 Tax=Micromonospora rubida TaxID=2697657 RepID=A0ABW7SQF9_9ACTN